MTLALLGSAGCYSGWDGAKQSGSASDADSAAAEDGGSGEDTGDAPPAEACGGAIPDVVPHAMHRLTPLQYTNTIRDLFGDPEFEASYADLDPIPSLLGVRQLRTDAELVLARRDSWGTNVYGCDTSGAADDACAEAFIAAFGAKAFRRPLTAEEEQSFRDLYASASSEFTFADAMDVVLASMLGAPQFLYLPEVGEPIEGAPANLRRLVGYEVASRMSYLLWDTMPDDSLLAAAEAGELAQRDGLRAQAERMLADPRAEGMIQDFMWTWLQLDGGQLHHALEQTEKDPALFPEYGPALQEAMRTEIEALVHEVYFGEDGSFDSLMTSNRAYVNASLAALYGVPGPANDDTFEWVDLDPSQRAGLLTRAGFLTVFATSTVQAPIRRGVLVIEEVLCSELGPPPPDVDNSPVDGGEDPDGGEVLSVREAVEARTKEGLCQTCHGIVNPAGFAFEHYDAIGRWQTEEVTTGQPIDSSGALKVSDADGPVADALELSQKLAGSATARDCFAGRWLFRATGTAAADVGECDREETLTAFAESGDVRELLVNIVLSDAFRFINTGDE